MSFQRKLDQAVNYLWEGQPRRGPHLWKAGDICETRTSIQFVNQQIIVVAAQKEVHAREARAVNRLERLERHALYARSQLLIGGRGHDELDVPRAAVLLRVIEKRALRIMHDVLARQARARLVIAQHGTLNLARVQALFDDYLP